MDHLAPPPPVAREAESTNIWHFQPLSYKMGSVKGKGGQQLHLPQRMYAYLCSSPIHQTGIEHLFRVLEEELHTVRLVPALPKIETGSMPEIKIQWGKCKILLGAGSRTEKRTWPWTVENFVEKVTLSDECKERLFPATGQQGQTHNSAKACFCF